MARSALSRIRAFFNKGKNLIDLLDNLWSACRGALPAELIPILTPFILGCFGCIAYLGEGVDALRCAYRAYKNEHIGQRKTRFVSSLLITVLAGAGLGMAIPMLASSLGLVVSAITLTSASILIPGLLTAISSLSFWRKGYVFWKCREQERQEQQELDALMREIKLDPGCSIEERAARTRVVDEKKELVKKWSRRRLRLEREMAFSLVGLLASSLVMASTIMGTAALVGSSVASFGVLPLVLMVVGMVSGILCQLAEYVDRKYDFRFTLGLRAGFIKLWNWLSPEPVPKYRPQEKRASLNSFIYEQLAEHGLLEMAGLCPAEPPAVSSPVLPAALSPKEAPVAASLTNNELDSDLLTCRPLHRSWG